MIKMKTIASAAIICLILFWFGCKPEENTSSTTGTATTSTTATTGTTATTAPPLGENGLIYEHSVVETAVLTNMRGACEFGTDLTVVSGDTSNNKQYILTATFSGANPASGKYKTVAPKGEVTPGKCAIFITRAFSGTEQYLYTPVDTEIELTAINGYYKVSFPRTKFIAIGGSSFFAYATANKVGCN